MRNKPRLRKRLVPVLSWLLVNLFISLPATFSDTYVERIPANIRRDGGVARMVRGLLPQTTTINYLLTVS